MRQFYEHVLADEKTMRFFTECAICGSRKYSHRIPAICRKRILLKLLENGEVGGIRQAAYNHAKARSVQYLARFFNKCRCGGKWVCDDCFDTGNDYGYCKQCMETVSKRQAK